MSMTFMDFMDHCEKNYAMAIGPADSSIRKMNHCFSKTHVFYMGDDSDIQSAIKEVELDLMKDIVEASPRLLLPYDDSTFVSTLNGNWIADRIILVRDTWVNIIKDLMVHDFRKKSEAYPGITEQDIKNGMTYLIWRVQDQSIRNISSVVWLNIEIKTEHKNIHKENEYPIRRVRSTFPVFSPLQFPLDEEALHNFKLRLTDEVDPIVRQLTLVSHPNNYIVRVSPHLTTKEHHQVDAGRRNVSPRKRPYFIVVDHDVLITMRKGETSGPKDDRNSPCPHHRRGHWARLSTRCRHARLLGKARIWKRPTFVGDTKFEDSRNRYEVLLDFSKSKEGKNIKRN